MDYTIRRECDEFSTDSHDLNYYAVFQTALNLQTKVSLFFKFRVLLINAYLVNRSSEFFVFLSIGSSSLPTKDASVCQQESATMSARPAIHLNEKTFKHLYYQTNERVAATRKRLIVLIKLTVTKLYKDLLHIHSQSVVLLHAHSLILKLPHVYMLRILRMRHNI